MENVLYPIAKDIKGNLININFAKKKSKYYCIACNEEMVFKSSGKFGPRRKTPHFSHKPSVNCNPETALHIASKELVTKKLNDFLNSSNFLEFSWNCTYCKNIHKGNYTKKLRRIELEYNLNFCRPDIALLDVNDEVYAVIEIVVTHKPEEKVVNYYYDNDIILIQLNIKSIDDIDRKLKAPDFVNFCVNPKCKICNNFKDKIIMTIINAKCYNCLDFTKVALMTKNYNFLFGPEKFSKEEVLLAKNNQVVIHEKYLGNACKSCGKLLNNKFNLNHYLLYADISTFESKNVYIKYDCKYCMTKNS